MIRPKRDLLLFDVFASCLWVADGVFRHEGLCARVLTRERDVVWWVAVSGGEFELEGFLEDNLDVIHDLAAVLDGECAVLLLLARLWKGER